MTNTVKRRKLSHEILSLIGISAAVSLVLFWILSGVAVGVVETYCFEHDIPMTEYDWMDVDQWIFSLSAVFSCCAFTILFLLLLGDRIAYIRKITVGIDELRNPERTVRVPLEGNNELTALAAAVNEMSAARKQIRLREQTLAWEKEQLIRTLSHDIRTPLTSILAYSDYLTAQETLSPQEQRDYLHMIQKKAEQIRDLTAVLLDGSRRNPVYYDDGKLLLEQIVAEFEEALDEQFTVRTDFSDCPPFSGTFDVQELRRIFDNLSSNVRKYADPGQPVSLAICYHRGFLSIRQRNGILPQKPSSESYRIGLNSIRRIAQHYGGSVAVEENSEFFSISITLSGI